MKLTNTKINDAVGVLMSAIHAAEDCELKLGQINTNITKAAKALVGLSFVCRADGEITVVQATDVCGRQFKGRCVYVTYTDSPTNYDLYTDQSFFFSNSRIERITIITAEEFETLYKAAQNIISDRQLQINELVKVIEACANESVKHENE